MRHPHTPPRPRTVHARDNRRVVLIPTGERIITVRLPAPQWDQVQRIMDDFRLQRLSNDDAENQIREIMAPYCPVIPDPATDEIIFERDAAASALVQGLPS